MSLTSTNFCEIANQLTEFPKREIFATVVTVGFFFFDYIAVPLIGLINNRVLPDKATRKTKFDLKDYAFINFNRMCTIVFLYFLIQTTCSKKYFQYDLASLALDPQNGQDFDLRVLAKHLLFFGAVFFPVAIIVYDFGYTIFHRILHYNWLYPYIHKHHHLQYSPYLGNVDAINVHPFEFIVGEFNHLLAMAVVSRASQKVLGVTPHAFYVLLYIVITGVLSTLNHTRIDVRLSYLYSVWWHDLHHRFPPCNYGQYTMLWDYVFGWYLPESTQTIVGKGREVNGDGTFVEDSSVVARSSSVAESPARPSLVKGSKKLSSSTATAVVPVDATPSPSKGKKSSKGRASSTKKGRKTE